MFFFSGSSSILIYLLSLAVVWGAILVNSFVYTTLKKEIKNQNSFKVTVKDNSRISYEKTYFVQPHKYAHQKKTGIMVYKKPICSKYIPLQAIIKFFPTNIYSCFDNTCLLRAPPQLTITSVS